MSKNTKTVTKTAQISDIPKKPIGFLRYVTKPHVHWSIIAIVAAALASAASQSTSLFFKWIVEAVESGDKDSALFFGLMYPIAIFTVQMMYRFSGWMGMLWVVNTKKYTYDILVQYISSHSHSYFANRFAGSLLSEVSNVVNAMESFIIDFLWTHLNAFVAFLVTFVFILQVDVSSGLLFVALILTLVLVNMKLAPKKRELSRVGAETATKLRGSIVDMLSNISAVRQYARVTEEVHTIGSLSVRNRDAQRVNWMYSERSMVINSIILLAFSALIFYLLVERWRLEEITTAEFVFVLALISQLTGTLVFIGRVITNTARVIGEAEEGLDDILLPYEITDKIDAGKMLVNDGKIEWDNVSFTYESTEVFKGFNLTIVPGQRVGLVGPSGAGKTTFVSLLLRQHELGDGSIAIDGQDISEVTQDSLRNNISIVPQEPLLFHRSIRENIAYGKPDATDEEIEAVAKKAQAHEFISDLSEGYNTLVGERGVKLSGGQKQRVAIARAMLKNAPILVLDEATSALDSESEVAIQKALHALMEGKTVVAIAHRLSTLREMDRIIVLENGKIIEDGTHDTLAASGGTYERLWNHQAGGFLTE